MKRKSFFQRAFDKVNTGVNDLKPELIYDQLVVPYDVAVDDNGVIYVVDDSEDRVIKYDSTTKKRELIGERVSLSFPTGIDTAGERLYVTDFSRQVNRVYIFSTNGQYIGRIPGTGSSDVSMRNPKALTVMKDDLYVCDRGNNRILVFSTDGALKKTIDLERSLKEPNGIAVTQSGIMMITLKLSGNVAKLSGGKAGNFKIYREENNETKTMSLSKPSGIAIDQKGFVYIADTANRRVVVTNPMGKIVATIESDKIKDFETYYPMSVKYHQKDNSLYIVGGNRYSYDVSCGNGACQGKVWRVKL